ncbi:chloride channel protein [Nocardioides bruguierae]|uniref:chloride channel protein n=1 Tax=Nocardioides bruguierae TaxID=2945102 RepID=UPI002021D07C|nr:chloride channel protein [Nocardioides bruguierae]MCL8024711.1 chloride channel protein [Nocardioides bruguierae]
MALARTTWLALVLGAVVGALSAGYLVLVRLLTRLVWDGTEPRLPGEGAWQVVLVCVAGGVVVGLLRGRHDRDAPHDLEDFLAVLDGLTEPGAERAPLPKATWLLRAGALGVVSLAAGASLGPEAPLLLMASGLGQRAARILRVTRHEAAYLSSVGAVSGLFGGPLGAVVLPVEGSRRPAESHRLIGAGVVAAISGLVTLLVLLPGEGLHRYALPDPGTLDGRRLLEALLWTVPAAALAALAGLALLLLMAPARGLAERALPHPVPRAAAGGAVLGLLGVLQPLALFSGEHSGQELIDAATSAGVLALLGVAVAKLLATLACLSTGWFGGQIFPVVLSGMAVGLAVAVLAPDVPVGALAAAGGAAACVVLLRRPLAVVALLLFFFPLSAMPGLAAGAAVGMLVLSLLGDRVPQPAHAGGH